ncbi:nucleotidyltransferase family protein [Seonamhaeicola sp.]|uniref:nucleotidyltransferase family protein n=1 Tax=Seonamhaeicola sp. TaxID=1912245 RepID=UPI0026266636|nr:nucleotidyltransferase family protein [Seonamhaeicola sp.]
MEVLKAISTLNLNDCWVGAGFIRNLIWDELHSFQRSGLNDIDIVYFDRNKNPFIESKIKEDLETRFPKNTFEIKNQFYMSEPNGDPEYKSTMDAISYWPEKETAIIARLNTSGTIEVCSPFELESIFDLHITWNTKREQAIFQSRIQKKNWLQKWPLLSVKI